MADPKDLPQGGNELDQLSALMRQQIAAAAEQREVDMALAKERQAAEARKLADEERETKVKRRCEDFTSAIENINLNLIDDPTTKANVRYLKRALSGDTRSKAESFISEFVKNDEFHDQVMALETDKSSFPKIITERDGNIPPEFLDLVAAAAEEAKERNLEPPGNVVKKSVGFLTTVLPILGPLGGPVGIVLDRYMKLRESATFLGGLRGETIDLDTHISRFIDRGTRGQMVELVTDRTKDGHEKLMELVGEICPKLNRALGSTESLFQDMAGKALGLVPENLRQKAENVVKPDSHEYALAPEGGRGPSRSR
jgi:hypothetical protein